MHTEGGLHSGGLALLTDLYQLTMAYGYWHQEKTDREAVFHMFFRENPFGGGYSVAAGLEQVVELLDGFGFGAEDLRYLETLDDGAGGPLFSAEFLEYLAELRFTCDVDAVPEGTVVFPYEPLLRIRGPLVQCQLVETPLLNLLNFQTLIATKAARVVNAAQGDPVIEFGLRRAQGPDGGVTASRAAYVGGCSGTSNVLAGKVHGIPVKGTHAHSWVMAFDSEEDAFEAYAQAMPGNCIFLVDTFDTLEGVRNAIEVGRRLRERGHEMIGIRLDSGDLTWLSVQARALLDEAGFPDAVIVASNELDERAIADLKAQGARIDVWGVGTKLVTGYGQPALGGVYKLSAIRSPGGSWEYKLKLSEQAAKVTNPGVLQVRRFASDGEPAGDMIFDEEHPPSGEMLIVDPADPTRRKRFDEDSTCEDLLVPVFRGGTGTYELPSLEDVRVRTLEQLERFDPSILRLSAPHEYPVGLETGLHDTKTRLILEARGFADDPKGV
jgi:nicotinate phosphoribosyltransferase